MNLRALHNYARADAARRLARQQAVLFDSPQEIIAPLRSGWCRITDATGAGDGVYGITEQWWDPSAGGGDGGWVNATSPPGLVGVSAREVRGATSGTTGTYGYFWQARSKDGLLEPLIELPPVPLIWAEAKQNWSKVTGGATWDNWRVKGYPIESSSPGGDPDTESEVDVYLPYKPTGHPNVVDGDVLGYVTVGSYHWCVTPYLDARIQTIRMWSGAAGEVPDGWQLADGSNDPQGNPVPDLSGKFLVGYKDGDADYGTIGNTGGNQTHTHDSHPSHTHSLTTCGISNPDGLPPYYVLSSQTTSVESSTLTHSSSDHRPPYYAVAYIIRVDNSVAWT